MARNPLEVQLKETCQLTGADWAAWLEREEDWTLRASYKVGGKKREALFKHLQLASVSSWINGALTGNRSRSRRLPPESDLASANLYIFPDQVTQRVIAVGAPDLTTVAQRFWRVVALGDYFRPWRESAPAAGSPAGAFGGLSYHLPEALNQALSILLQSVGIPAGWLAIRSGDFLEVRVWSNCPEPSERRISVEANPLLREIVHGRKARLVERTESDWAMVPRAGFRPESHSWIGQPLLIGRRMIGLISLWLDVPCSRSDWNRIGQLAANLAPSVEDSLTFSDLSSHLRRMALLNDFAVTISSAADVGQIVQRMFALLQRAFDTERIVFFVRPPDAKGVQRYLMQENSIAAQNMPAVDAPYSRAAEKGEIVRVDSIENENTYSPFYPGSRSALMMPLKFRRQVVGAIGLESLREGGFTIYDEHLLAVIASHLAGLLENNRLRQEAESRARNLSLIHDVLEKLIGLTDAQQVAQIAAELMATNFAYELIGIALFDRDGDLSLAGIGGTAAGLARDAVCTQSALNLRSIVDRLAMSAQSLLVNDVTSDPLYFPLLNRSAGSAMCVALKDGDSILGVLDVESQKTNAFAKNDLLLLESLAGILSAVISNAGQYQRLQATVEQLQTARLELQERIAAQKMAESRLVQAAKLAAVGEMAAGIAHELNNPLTTVSGFTELVLEGIPENQPVRADLELVLREAQRARGVVRRLLDFARQTDSVRTRCDITEIVADVLALTNHLLRTGGILVHAELKKNLPWVAVDRNQIKQVLLNLIHNAMHAMPAGGRLHVSTTLRRRDEKEWIVISVQDSGTGIAPENVEHMFEPFFTTRSKEGGTGLGLSVSYGIVIDHGGSMDVESEVGEGSTFTVWLPTEVN